MAEIAPDNVKRSGLLRSSAVVGLATLSSRVLGLVRDVALAAVIGASGNADAFFVAFKIPNFLRRLFAEGAFAQAFVPVLSATREEGGYDAVRALIDRVAGALGGTLILLTGITILAAPVVALVFAPGFSRDPAKLALTADLVRITFPYLFLISMTGFAGGILNSYGRFAIPAFTPVLLNLSLIAAALLGVQQFEEPVFALAWGVLIAGFLQLLFQLPALYSIGLVPRPQIDTQHEGVRRILRLLVPALFGVSVSQINLLLDTVLASLLPEGSVSWLYYSDRLTELPLGVFAIAIATVILPALSAQRAQSDAQAYAATLDWAIRTVLLIALPATAALLLLAEPILTTLFQYGEFGADDVAMASHSLRAYTLGLGAFMLVKVLAPGFYAQEDMKTPVRIGIIAMVSNMVMNPLFVFPLMWQFNLGHVGLALATSASAWLNVALLYRGLRRQDILHSGLSARVGHVFRLSIAVAIMVIVVLLVLPAAEQWQGWSWLVRGQVMAGVCIAGGGVYLGALYLLGFRPADLRGPTTID
ncbi:integral membrane protein MviN [Luminiphilus syltensis NOR5-1B]|uniref:Probable lipid II flippase MurJ n=1 Tax=Luminiphilus syltensis NOR5-1B TaxID=565045 RepID=B8KX09_9GAMM|nr:murein biosynthesis integral membrane protein MurJ [Luminiphilus syltensis]EED34551.1 integral membrane protein MviN [Luminiphilus syltensis NOR5-1B]